LKKVVALILAGGEGARLSVLSEKRAKPSVPFAGKYRIIDFTLSNCVNSGIYNVAVLTQYRPHSLNDHIGIGKPCSEVDLRVRFSDLQPTTRREGSRKGISRFVAGSVVRKSREKHAVTSSTSVLKLTQVGEESILRRSREPSLRN